MLKTPDTTEFNSLALGDLNRDGKLDIVTADFTIGGHEIYVLLGASNGEFEPVQATDVGDRSFSLALGDVDGDDKLDLVTAEYLSNRVALFHGQGDGTFDPPARFTVVNGPYNIALADLNGDGKKDVVTANFYSDDVSVLLSVPGGLAPPTVYPVGPGTYSVAVGDLDGDGQIDIVTTNFESNDVSVLIADGFGRFLHQSRYPVFDGPGSIAIADLDRDGDRDLVVANTYASSVSILSPAPAEVCYSSVACLPVGFRPRSVAVGDLFGDGIPDVITSNEGGSISILRGRASGGFDPEDRRSTGGTAAFVAAGDFNGDAVQDLVFSLVSQISIYYSYSNGTLIERPQGPINLGSGTGVFNSIALGDLDRDGKLDIVTGDYNIDGHEIYVLLGASNGEFEPVQATDVGDRIASLALGDVDGDDKLDLVTAEYFSNRVALFHGRGDGTFDPPARFTVADGPYNVALADLNGDGKKDIVTANFYSDDVSVLLSVPGGLASPAVYPVGPGTYSVALGDLNGDGRIDIATTNFESDDVSILLSDGVGGFLHQSRRPVNDGPGSIAIADLDRNGDRDLIIANTYGSRVSILAPVPVDPSKGISLSPVSASEGGSAFTLEVHGGCFDPDSTVLWNGSPRPTTFVDSTRLDAAIPASDLAITSEFSIVPITVESLGGTMVIGPALFTVQGASVAASASAIAEPDESASASVAPGSAAGADAGITASVTNVGGGDPVVLGVASYTQAPGSGSYFDAGEAFVDLQILGADSGDSAAVNFYYPSNVTGAAEDQLSLLYFDGSIWANVRSSGGVAPLKDTTDDLDGTISGGRFTVNFDATSAPGITELTGTIFAFADGAPAILQIDGPTGPLIAGSNVNLSVTFRATGTLAAQRVGFTWDDGSVESLAPQSTGLASASHTFSAAGVYTVAVTLLDGSGRSASSRFEFVVIYDPTAGFVTGGGWLNSPPGALASDPLAAGKATFGFVSRYARGATVPTGKTEFKLHCSSFEFRSTVYQWLVVAGAKAQYKGSGAVNGSGNYGFLLTATDGNLRGGGGQDRLRLKIWNPLTGERIYDNVAGASDDLDQANPQVIGGGSIVIHR